jgi:hypothetical protein
MKKYKIMFKSGNKKNKDEPKEKKCESSFDTFLQDVINIANITPLPPAGQRVPLFFDFPVDDNWKIDGINGKKRKIFAKNHDNEIDEDYYDEYTLEDDI